MLARRNVVATSPPLIRHSLAIDEPNGFLSPSIPAPAIARSTRDQGEAECRYYGAKGKDWQPAQTSGWWEGRDRCANRGEEQPMKLILAILASARFFAWAIAYDPTATAAQSVLITQLDRDTVADLLPAQLTKRVHLPATKRSEDCKGRSAQ